VHGDRRSSGSRLATASSTRLTTSPIAGHGHVGGHWGEGWGGQTAQGACRAAGTAPAGNRRNHIAAATR
jgi:hypothetical protein